MINFTKRNLLVFFRDKSSVFFSLLSVFIIIGLYALFLGDVWTNSFSDLVGVRYMMDSWIVAGLLAVTSVTATMGAFGIMVEDKTKMIIKDIHSSPIARGNIAGGYIFSAFIVGVIMCLVTLILTELYILANGGILLSGTALVKVLGLIILSAFSNTTMVLFIVSFFKSNSAFATASTIIGTMIGFLTGIYIPVGTLPDAVQWVIKVFPPSHSAALLRQVMMADPLSKTFEGVPVEYLTEFKETMGVTFQFGDTVVTPAVSILILVASGLLFLGLSILSLSRKKK